MKVVSGQGEKVEVTSGMKSKMPLSIMKNLKNRKSYIKSSKYTHNLLWIIMVIIATVQLGLSLQITNNC